MEVYFRVNLLLELTSYIFNYLFYSWSLKNPHLLRRWRYTLELYFLPEYTGYVFFTYIILNASTFKNATGIIIFLFLNLWFEKPPFSFKNGGIL